MNNEFFDYIKHKYSQNIRQNKLVYNLDSVEIKDIFVLIEIFESLKNNDEAKTRKIINGLSTKKKEQIKKLLDQDHILVVVVSFVNSKITSKELLSYFDHNKILKDGL